MKFGVVVVRPKKKGKGLPSCVARTRRIKIYVIEQKRVNKKTILGDVVESSRDIDSWEEMCGEKKQCKDNVRV